MSIKKYGAAILRERARPVTEFGSELIGFAEKMKQLMEEAAGVGLAANQAGIDKSLFIAKLGDEVYAFVNPEILPLSSETVIDEEGCLSIPGVWVDVERHRKIRLTAQNLEGQPIRVELEDYFARVVQHEIDHLNGVLIIDRISTRERRRVADQLEEIEDREKSQPL